MKILNYNKTNHDIYKFAGEENIVVCYIPTSASEFSLHPGYRRHAPVIGWNYEGLWNNNIDGSGVPDWSGLSVRSRGSNLYGVPNGFFRNIGDDNDDWNAGSSDPKFSDLSNWNNGIPPHIIISKHHFIGCAHYSGSNPSQTFDILDRDGVMHSITGTLISNNFNNNDTNVYRITLITGGSLPPATEINEIHKIKIYKILNLRGKQNMDGLRIWHQDNNGKFITTTRFNGQLPTPALAIDGQPTAPNPSSGLPILVSLGPIFGGDSGSPSLATYQGETYLLGMNFSSEINRDLSNPVMFNFLQQLLLSDQTPVVISLFDPTPPERYSCNTSTGDCSPSINGTWFNKDDCDAECDIIVTNRVDCITGQCTVTDPTGVYATIQECQSSFTCPPPTQQNSASLTYDVWAAAFSGSQWITPNHPWMTGDYGFHSVVPMAQMESTGNNNGHRTAPTTPNSFSYNLLKDRLSTIPKGRRVLLNWYTINDVSPYRKLENDYYKNTSDGFLYKDAKFLSVWQDTGSIDAGQELTRIFGLLNSDEIDFDYIFDDHEAEPGLYGMEGQNAYPLRDSSGNIISIYDDVGVLPDARVFGAIISDPRFVTKTNRFTGRSFSDDFLDFYKQLSKQPDTTLTTNELLQSWLQVNTGTEFYTPSDSPEINPITSRPYSDERDFMIPAWQGCYYLHLKYAYWGETTNNSLSSFSRYADVIMSNYSNYPISIEEAEYTRDSNNIRTFIPPLSNTTIASGGHAMFGIPLNIIYAYWTDPLVNPNTAYNGNSGYVRNPQTDMDRYNWAYYLINPSTIPATVDFKKYAETTSIPDFVSKRAHKQLINDVKFMRHILRSDPFWWQQNVPNISHPRIHYYDGPNHNDWHELVYHVILHGLLYVLYFSESYDPNNVKLLHDALVEWKRISNNSGVEPCSRVDGNVSSNATPVDRVLLHDAVENILISGGRSLKRGKYIWRLTAPPSMRVGNFIYFRRLPSETDLTLPETIVVDCSVKINGRGAWIVRDVQGMPKYESYIPTTPPPSSWDCINDICTEFPDLSHPYASLGECSLNCSIPPTVTYDCIDGTCEQVFGDPVGIYQDLLSCTLECRVREINTWECDGQCQEITGPSGRYTTEEQCLGSDCGNEVPVTTYNCVSDVCVAIDGPDGTYRTSADCINSGCGIIIPPTPPNIINKILENPQFIDLTKSIPTTPLSGYPYNSR